MWSKTSGPTPGKHEAAIAAQARGGERAEHGIKSFATKDARPIHRFTAGQATILPGKAALAGGVAIVRPKGQSPQGRLP
jgi:hypothetical protein